MSDLNPKGCLIALGASLIFWVTIGAAIYGLATGLSNLMEAAQ